MGNWHLGRPATIRNVVSRLPLGFGLGRHAKILLLTVTLGAGLVLVGCGDDDAATTPAPAPPPPPAPAPAPEPEPEPEPEAMAPATPTGLMVSATTETSITWTWDAVEGAIGYAVQVSPDEMFGADDQIVPSAENTFTASDLPPETSVYVRVAAAAGTLEAPLLSGWTTHVTGMSAMPVSEPEPEPEALDPVMVAFSLSEDADDQNFMVALAGDDEETAMAMVNTEIMVESNVTAIITPMFIEGAAGVTVMAAADNMPFAYVDWGRLQADVVSDGATFMVQRATVGANQEMEPTGDAAYVTCGPFECADGMDAPEISIENSAACTAFAPTLNLDMGLIDNDQQSFLGTAATEDDSDVSQADAVRVFDGLDLGWTYTSSSAMKVTHDLAVTSGEDSAGKASSSKSLEVTSIGRVHVTDDASPAAGAVYYALSSYKDGDPLPNAPESGQVGSCQPREGRGLQPDGTVNYGYNDNVASRITRPDNCFRLTVDGDIERNYLENYMVALDAGITVSWGEIAWEAWEELTCEPVMIDVALDNDVDVCSMFEAEVGRLTDEPTAKAEILDPGNTDDPTTQTSTLVAATLRGFQLGYYVADVAGATVNENRHQFTAMWYQDGSKGMNDLHRDYALDEPGSADEAGTVRNEQGTVWKAGTWVPVLDKDFDPMYGDFGKIDSMLVGIVPTADGNADNIREDDDTYECSADDGGSTKTSSLCDAEDVVIETSVTFVDGMMLCDPVEVSYTLTCQWDASGNLSGSLTGHISTGIVGGGVEGTDNTASFVSCEVEQN